MKHLLQHMILYLTTNPPYTVVMTQYLSLQVNAFHFSILS